MEVTLQEITCALVMNGDGNTEWAGLQEKLPTLNKISEQFGPSSWSGVVLSAEKWVTTLWVMMMNTGKISVLNFIYF